MDYLVEAYARSASNTVDVRVLLNRELEAIAAKLRDAGLKGAAITLDKVGN